MWDEIIHPFSNFNGAAADVWEWISNLILMGMWLLIRRIWM